MFHPFPFPFFLSLHLGSNTSALLPSEKYAPQAKQLQFLGFTNSEAVFEALDAVGGDINAAIQKLVPKSRPAFDL